MNQPVSKQEVEAKPSRRTEPKEVRRSQLIEATINSIAKHGIGGTTMSTVTEDAGLSIGLVNFHFKSKQNLFKETLVHLASEHHEQWLKAYRDAGLTASEKLLAIVDSHFHPRICTRRKLAVWFAFFGEGGRRAVYRSLIDDIDHERFETSVRLIRDIAEQTGREGPAPRQVARSLEGLYDGLWLNILMYPRHFTRDGAKQQIRIYLAALFPESFPASTLESERRHDEP